MSEWSVICLCADWCGACREYRAVFDSVAQQNKGIRFEWIDIEDAADRLGSIDIETFPTILISQNGAAQFFSPLLPRADVLTRLIEALQAKTSTALATPAAQNLVNALQLHKPTI